MTLCIVHPGWCECKLCIIEIKVVLIETHLFGGGGGRRGFHRRVMTVMSIGSLVTIGVSVAIRLVVLIRRGLWCCIGTLMPIGAMVPRGWLVTITTRGEGGFGKGDEK